jgi:hypothetical protein
MKSGEREVKRRKLDQELRFFRMAAKQRNPTNELLRNVR